MPRIRGQIDRSKAEAILAAASHVFSEFGAAGSIALIARRAGVSKQTIYNQFGTRHGLLAALPGCAVRPSAEALRALGCGGHGTSLAGRLASLVRPAATPMAHGEAGAIRDRVAAELVDAGRRRILDCADPDLAAAFLVGMVAGAVEARRRDRTGEGENDDGREIVEEAVMRFVNAYAKATSPSTEYDARRVPSCALHGALSKPPLGGPGSRDVSREPRPDRERSN